MISKKSNSNVILKTLLCVFSLLFILASPAAAFWEQTFENHQDDYSLSIFTPSSFITSYATDHGSGYRVTGATNNMNLDISLPYSGYLGLNIKGGWGPSFAVTLKCYDSDNVNYANSALMWDGTGAGDANIWHRIEFITSGSVMNCYRDGVLINTVAFTDSAKKHKMVLSCTSDSGTGVGYIDDISAKSCHATIGMDNLVLDTDNCQYYRLGLPNAVTGKYYYVKVFSPDSKTIVYEKTFTNTTLRVEDSIPIQNLSAVGEYTVHLYRHDSVNTDTFVCMKTFEKRSSTGSNEGSITLEKSEYEAGDTVKFWVHLPAYTSGYKVQCEFPVSGGSNFRKVIDVTNSTFYGSFTIPDIGNVIGSHTVYLINPSGINAASADFNVFIPGLADVALDKSEYSRNDVVTVFYKDAKAGSSLNVVLRYGGSTSTSQSYTISNSGNVRINLSTLPAADSIYVYLKDSTGYSVDNDNANIVVGNFVLSGRVYNAKTGEALSEATVTVLGNASNTDINGNYNVSSLAGFANYTVTKAGYQNISGTVAVFNMDTIHNFYLTQILNNGGTGVHGTVVSDKTDLPLTGASVVVVNNDNGKRYSTIVNNVGYYELNNVDLAGNLTITTSFANYDTLIANTLVNEGSLNILNFRLNAGTGYEEVDISQTDGGKDSSNPGETAEEKAYREKYGEMGKHPFDFNANGEVENSEWKYAGERFVMLIGILAFMGFLMLINRRR